jgi:hypothetical protein
LVERVLGRHEVRGSTPLRSTKNPLRTRVFCLLSQRDDDASLSWWQHFRSVGFPAASRAIMCGPTDRTGRRRSSKASCPPPRGGKDEDLEVQSYVLMRLRKFDAAIVRPVLTDVGCGGRPRNEQDGACPEECEEDDRYPPCPSSWQNSLFLKSNVPQRPSWWTLRAPMTPAPTMPVAMTTATGPNGLNLGAFMSGN